MKAATARYLHLVGATGTVRSAKYQERDYVVVPVVALVEGVIHPVNAPTPELALAEEFLTAPGGWNGRPVFADHPTINGTPVSGNSPEVLPTSCGLVFNAAAGDKKLKMEAWLEVAKCTEGTPAGKILAAVNAGEMVEVSVGVFVVAEETSGTYGGRKYKAIWRDVVPDHLALLSEGKGACSIEMGCGTPRAAIKHLVTAEGIQEEPTSMAEPKSQKKKTAATFLSSLMAKLRSAQPAEDMSDRDLRGKLDAALREMFKGGRQRDCMVEAWYPVLNPDTVVYSCYEGDGIWCYYERPFALDANGIVTLGDTEIEVEPVLRYEPVLMAEEVTAAAGARNSKKDQARIQTMHDHATALGASCSPKAAANSGCGCGGSKPTAAATTTLEGDTQMKREERIAALMNSPHNIVKDQKALEAASDETLTGLEAHVTAAAAAAAPAPAAPAAPAASAAPVVPTVAASKPSKTEAELEAEFLATAPKSIRTLIDNAQKQTEARRTAILTGLKGQQEEFTEDELKVMPIEQLERIARLAGANAATDVDFSGLGLPRAAAENDYIQNPPDGYAAVFGKK